MALALGLMLPNSLLTSALATFESTLLFAYYSTSYDGESSFLGDCIHADDSSI